jgi:hypothetical protein
LRTLITGGVGANVSRGHHQHQHHRHQHVQFSPESLFTSPQRTSKSRTAAGGNVRSTADDVRDLSISYDNFNTSYANYSINSTSYVDDVRQPAGGRYGYAASAMGGQFGDTNDFSNIADGSFHEGYWRAKYMKPSR